MQIVDLRPVSCREREERARSPLGREDERIALMLSKLSKKLSQLDRDTNKYSKLIAKIRKIGEYLCSNGGTDRMDLICYRVYFLYGSSKYVRQNWDGICGWQY